MTHSRLGGELVWWCPSLDDANNGSTTTLADLSGNARNASLVAIDADDWEVDTSNGGIRSLKVDGIPHNEYWQVTSPSYMSNISAETISFWFSRSSSTHTAFFGRRGGTNYNNISVWSDSKIYWMIGANKYAYSTFSGTGWNHVCLCFDGTQSTDTTKYRAYVNGSLASLTFSGSPMGTVTPTQSDVLIAGLSSGFYDIGKKDDMRVFNRAISASEVLLLASKRGYQNFDGAKMLVGVAA